jgi:hypothetical protein
VLLRTFHLLTLCSDAPASGAAADLVDNFAHPLNTSPKSLNQPAGASRSQAQHELTAAPDLEAVEELEAADDDAIDASAAPAHGCAGQQHQQLALELMSAYTAGRREVLVRPHTLMFITGQRLMAAAQAVPQLSPLQQTPLAAAVAGCLVQRELQLLHSRAQDAALTGLHLLNAFMLRNKFDPKLAGQRQLGLDMPGQCAVTAAAAGTNSELRVSTVPAAVFAFPLLQEQQVLAGATEQAGGMLLSSWLFVAPQLRVWQQLVQQLQQLKQKQQGQQQQQQQGEQQQGQEHQQPLASLQECKMQAEDLLRSMQLQPSNLAWLQLQLNRCTAADHTVTSSVKEESTVLAFTGATIEQQRQQQQRVAVFVQQRAGQAVQTKPGWLNVTVSHAAHVKVSVECLQPADAAACAAAQLALQESGDSSSSSRQEVLEGVQLRPLLLKALQQWCAYCQQQEQRLQKPLLL